MTQDSTDLLLERFQANLTVAREMLALAEAEPVVAGHAGQPRAHPGFAVAAKADEVALRIAVEVRAALGAVPDGGPTGFDELDAFDDLAARRERQHQNGGSG
jgi:hypothetical protein